MLPHRIRLHKILITLLQINLSSPFCRRRTLTYFCTIRSGRSNNPRQTIRMILRIKQRDCLHCAARARAPITIVNTPATRPRPSCIGLWAPATALAIPAGSSHPSRLRSRPSSALDPSVIRPWRCEPVIRCQDPTCKNLQLIYYQ